ncbi:MAG: hypothetical protein Q9157_001771 [Trypethelium eluteriae]
MDPQVPRSAYALLGVVQPVAVGVGAAEVEDGGAWVDELDEAVDWLDEEPEVLDEELEVLEDELDVLDVELPVLDARLELPDVDEDPVDDGIEEKLPIVGAENVAESERSVGKKTNGYVVPL